LTACDLRVSNDGIALTKHGSPGPCVAISILRTISVPIISLTHLHVLPTSNSSVWCLAGVRTPALARQSCWPRFALSEIAAM